ncbi:hypothetical protein AX17_004769 [Amanita inopinata Kibby_2008]|nr:hypothetical protein AX17_004769 [Amanita inopinata Kibby_2008]
MASAVSNNVATNSVAVPQLRLATAVAGGSVTNGADVNVDAKTTADEENDTLGPLPDSVMEKQRKNERCKMVDWKKRKHCQILDGIADTEEKSGASSFLPIFATKKGIKLSKKKAGIIKGTQDMRDVVMAVSAAVPSGKSLLATVADRRAATYGTRANISNDRDAFGSMSVFGASRVSDGKMKGKAYTEIEAEEALYEIIDSYRGFCYVFENWNCTSIPLSLDPIYVRDIRVRYKTI